MSWLRWLETTRVRHSAIAVCAVLIASWIAYIVIAGKGFDFYAYLIAAAAFDEGIDVYAASATGRGWWNALAATLGLESYFAFPYRYPPLTALLVTPLLSLTPSTAFAVYSTVSGLCFMLAAWFLDRAMPVRTALPWLMLILALPVLTTLHAGQVNAFVLLSLAITLFALVGDRPVLAGAAIAAGAHIKMLPAIFLFYLLWRGNGTALIATVSFMIVFALLSLLIMDVETLLSAPGYILTQMVETTTAVQNQSLAATLKRLFQTDVSPALLEVPLLAQLARPVSTLLLGGLCIASMWPPGRGSGERAEVSLLVLIAVLLPNVTWYHGLALLVIPTTVILYDALSKGRKLDVIATLSAVAVVSVHGMTWKHTAHVPVVNSAACLAVLLLVVLAVRRPATTSSTS